MYTTFPFQILSISSSQSNVSCTSHGPSFLNTFISRFSSNSQQQSTKSFAETIVNAESPQVVQYTFPAFSSTSATLHQSSFKHSIIINYITYNISTSNYTEALQHIRHLLTEYPTTAAPLPAHIYDMMLYYLLSTSNTTAALHLLRYRRIPLMFLPQRG